MRSTVLVVLAVITLPGLSALDPAVAGMLPPEHVDVRAQFAEYVDAPLVELFRLREATRFSRWSARRVQVSVQHNAEHVYLVVVPELDGEFPVYSAGTFILRRQRDNGRINQLKIFLRSDPDYFVRIRPDRDDRSLMSVHLAGSPVQEDVTVPFGIPDLMASSFEDLVRSTESRVDWRLFFPSVSHELYRDVELMADRARSVLHTLPDAEDGAMDESGNLVFIESLVLQDQQQGFNCSGFAKWIVDGLYMGKYGSFLTIDAMKEKHLDHRGHRWSDVREDDRDPYFGLDWTRNLARAVLSAESGGEELDPEAADVRNVPFALYTEDVGFPVGRLGQIMYSLAISEPGNFYLASFNREFGSSPQLNQHVHVAVLFPYFTESGKFRTVVMERNVETSVESLVRRYGSDHIHLVRVRADESYRPPIILH